MSISPALIAVSVSAVQTAVMHGSVIKGVSHEKDVDESVAAAIERYLESVEGHRQVADMIPQLSEIELDGGPLIDESDYRLLAANDMSSEGPAVHDKNNYGGYTSCYTNCHSNCHSSRSWR